MSAADRVVRLDADEASLLAARILAFHLEGNGSFGDPDQWLDWGDLPHLDEDSFTMVLDGMKDVATELWDLVRSGEAAHDIDSAELLERAR